MKDVPYIYYIKFMKKKEYLVQVAIIEIRDLTAKDASGTSDPYVKITVGNLPSQVSTAKQKTTTAVFNQNFTFANLMMSDVDFENFEAKLEVYDQNQFFQNELIGVHSIGLATLYRNPSHEIFNKWLTLTDPKDVKRNKGYILVSAYIIGENDQPPVHDANENAVEDEPDPFGGLPDDQLTSEQLQTRREKQKQIAMVSRPQPYLKQAQLMVNLVKAEDLPVLNGHSVDSFISVRANGITQITNVIKNQQKPQYRVRMLFPITFPLNNDKIIIRVWDKRVCMSDTFIGQIPEVPSETDYFNITYLQSKGGVMPYRWFALYGIPPHERPTAYESNVLGYKRNPLGTYYYGRVLLSLNLTPSEKPEKMVQPLGIYREPPVEKYTIRLDTYEANQVNGTPENIFVRVRCGGDYLDSETGYFKADRVYQWLQKQIVQTKEVEVPKNVQEQTDLIIEILNHEKKRLAYHRISTLHPDLGVDRPVWYEMKALKSKGESSTIFCYLLLNLLFRPTSVISAMPKQLVKRNAILPYICRCYMYAGYDFCPDKVSEELRLRYEIRVGDKSVKSQKIFKNKNPIWNELIEMNVKLEQNLEFISNIVIQFWNDNKLIGFANVAALNCKVADGDGEQPQPIYQYYHVMNEGRNVGRVLLGMTLQRLKKNTQVSATANEFSVKQIFNKFQPYKILFPVYAVRLLPKKIKQSILKVRISIPNSEISYNEISIPSFLPGGEEETMHSPGYTDPNFLSLIELECELPQDPLFSPQLEIEIQSKISSAQRYYTTLPLFKYYPNISESLRSQLHQHFIISMEPGYNLPFQLKKEDEEIEIIKNPQNIDDGDDQEESEQKQSFPERKNYENKSKYINDTKKSLVNDGLKETILKREMVSVSQQITEQMRYKGIENAYVDPELDLEFTKTDLQEMMLEKRINAQKLTKLLTKLRKPNNSEATKQYLKKEILNQSFSPQNPDVYFSDKIIDESDDAIDYGRPIQKGPYEAVIHKNLPFQRIKLFEVNSRATGLGIPTSAIIKADVKIIPLHDSAKQSSKKTIRQMSVSDQQEHLKKLRDQGYQFDFFDPIFHDYLKTQQFRCKVRVYIYRGLCLAAQGENIDTYHYIAGQQSRNTANPYLEIEVGEPGQEFGDYVKKVSDPDRFIANNLNPAFMRSFELDGILPQDSYLNIRVMNKGIINSLIGAVKIDIEDRLMGERKLKSRLSYQAYMEYFEKQLNGLKYAENADQLKNELQAELANLMQKFESISSDLVIPVEYQQLRHPDKLVSQGQLEMFVEILPLEIARQIAPAKMIERVPQEYEVRIIVWETFKIALNPIKKCVDIYVKVTMDSSATGDGREISKETDCHMGSIDGDGEFNYRMKFPLKTPCQFPRMKVSAHDFSTFGTSPSVGEATISLKRVLSVMKTQSVYEMAPTKIYLNTPSAPDQDVGCVLLQMTILQKSMAEAKPVGDARDEPNTDPFLKTPTEGRGLGAFFKGIGIPWGMLISSACTILAPMFISALISFILFVKPGILMPPQP